MCWIHGQHLKMKQADLVVTKTASGNREEYTVSGIEEVADLREWMLSEDRKKADKFSLINKINNSKISLKCDTTQEADDWVAELKKILDAVGVQEPRQGGEEPKEPAKAKETAKPTEQAKAKETAKPTEQAKPKEGAKPAEPNKPKEGTKPAEPSKAKANGDGGQKAGTGGSTPAAAERDHTRPEMQDPKTEKLNGRHKFVYSNGDVYDGEWVNGKKQGTGTYTRADGSVYDGEYNRDRKHGKGRCTWVNGNAYIGHWVDGVQQGQGTLTCPDGRRYEGEWYGGKQHGKGTFSNKEGDVYG
jgi:hypothetical protein